MKQHFNVDDCTLLSQQCDSGMARLTSRQGHLRRLGSERYRDLCGGAPAFGLNSSPVFQRFAPDWHCDSMEQLSDYKACA